MGFRALFQQRRLFCGLTSCAVLALFALPALSLLNALICPHGYALCCEATTSAEPCCSRIQEGFWQPTPLPVEKTTPCGDECQCPEPPNSPLLLQVDAPLSAPAPTSALLPPLPRQTAVKQTSRTFTGHVHPPPTLSHVSTVVLRT